MKPRLVILGSSLTALAVARDAHARGLAPVLVDTEAGIAFATRRAQRVLAASAEEALARVLDHGGSANALVATGDDWLRFVAAHRARLDAAFGRVLHPSNPMLEILLDKHAFAQWCAANALPTPRTWLPDTEPGSVPLRFPLLVRPRATRHGRAPLPKAVEVHDERELREWVCRYRARGASPLVSESLLGRQLTQYSVPFVRNGTSMLSFVARKLRPGPERCAEGTLVEMTRNAAVEQLARRAAECAEYFGIGEAEILHAHDEGRSYLIEINARPWLQYALAPATGRDFLGLLLGREVAAAPRARQRTWINLRGDRAVAFDRAAGLVRRGQLGIGPYLRSLARCNVFAVFDVRDPLPFARMVLCKR